MTEQSSSKPDVRSLKTVSRRTALASFGNGVINPFIHIFAAQLGASPAELGGVRAINLTSPNIAQIPWGLAMDRLKKRVALIFLGGLFYACLLLPLLFINSMMGFIIVISLNAVSMAMMTPALNSLVGDLCKDHERGKIFALKRHGLARKHACHSNSCATSFTEHLAPKASWECTGFP